MYISCSLRMFHPMILASIDNPCLGSVVELMAAKMVMFLIILFILHSLSITMDSLVLTTIIIFDADLSQICLMGALCASHSLSTSLLSSKTGPSRIIL